jgi:hypothetical protein
MRLSPVLLLLIVASTPGAAQDTTIVRLRNAVGDTINLAERDSFRLFPNTPGFQRAVILKLPGPEYFAKVARIDGDSLFPVYYRIQPAQLERIRFLIDYREFVAQQQENDLAAVRSLASFWQSIESKPFQSIAEAHAPPPPKTVKKTPAATPGPPIGNEYRYHATLIGATAGSALGGCVGSWAGIQVDRYVATTNCLNQNVIVPVYSVNQPLFWSTACGLTVLGSAGGYLVGDKRDRAQPLMAALADEGKEWRTSLAIGAAIPGFMLGAGFALLTGSLHYGRTELPGEMPNDPSYLTVLPMALTGVCMAVEASTIGYLVGRNIDRRNAEPAVKKRGDEGR